MENSPPAHVDLQTLAACLSLDEETALQWVQDGILPRPINKTGKPRWRWSAVERALDGPAESSRVYFAECDGFIKIGFSSEVPRRIAALNYGMPRPLIFICSIPGDFDLEHDIHAKFSHLRVRGEWFRADQELLEFIEGMKNIDGTRTIK